MKAWLQAVRVNSLAISTIGVVAGTAVAVHDGHFNLIRFLLAWIGAVAIQAGTNLTNVYYNYKSASGAADPRAFDTRSSTGVLRAGLLTPSQVHAGGLVAFGAGITCGLILTWLCGFTILWLGLPAVAAGYFYAGPPVRYGYVALGVVSVFLFMGPVMVCGAYYVQASTFPASALAAAIPIGLLAAGIMHTNDLRDFDTDVRHGKRTIATLAGRRGAGYALAAMDALAFLVVVVAAVAGWLPWLALITLLAIPHAIGQVKTVLRETGAKELHDVWLRGVKLHMQFGLLLIVALLISAGWR